MDHFSGLDVSGSCRATRFSEVNAGGATLFAHTG